ncbi:starch synthase (maltosyl-transferring) [Okibacterium sp. HSC-33S16]|uniref:alpha-1,4-glucan--maltose-1-phosphate maltosyltransferase n=1 Tax=Okibacterium sp. HSC-33S16 TaxID=2910965 RepID=UPI00209DB350|nr:alpha-1,4-glucan--maltose-1-phosphate maltosyltransferase [Okibacterium sp. HSC-33S16]MCP2030588.1 starch synthase (maltosyl-transferring) [Okibacterium sp. HSC-33S16]
MAKKASSTPAAAAPRAADIQPSAPVQGIGRIPVLGLSPVVSCGRWPARGYVGEVIPFGATAFREGHDSIGVELLLTDPAGRTARHPMHLVTVGLDDYSVLAQVTTPGTWTFRVRAYADEWETWRHNAEIKIPAGIDVELMYTMGAELLSRAATDKNRPVRERDVLATAAETLLNVSAGDDKRFAVLSDPELERIVGVRPISGLASESEPAEIRVERARAGLGSWYEFFPRSEGAKRRKDGSWQSGTFRTAAKRLAGVAAMGFDVLYLPPIHPIGTSFRKGPNNTLNPGEHDPGSPWAIGSPAGGHDTIHPDLGTVEDFTWFIGQAAKKKIEVAIDLALQASPDHPWVTEHPEWFTTLPDGSIAYAENPPKKYQDIYPVNFDNDPEGIRAEVLRIVRYWISLGVKIFRVDNPHTKPVEFWEWLIATINAEHPDVIFLAEAFTRPAMMQALARVGFQQSYTYFTWRNTKEELEEFFTSISTETADFLRPNLFVNTPDILTEYLQFGGPAAFTIRAALAATAAPTWGVYAGFELFENVARPGAEENIDNEKYEYKPRDFAGAEAAGRSLSIYIGMLNRIRREHQALQQLRNLTLHTSDDDSMLVYSKHLDQAFTPSGTSDTILVVANVDPHSVRETMVHIDSTAFGIPLGTPYRVTDLITGNSWEWGTDNFVRLDAFVEPVHIFHVEELNL